MWLPPNYLQTRAIERPNDPSYLAFGVVEYFAVAVFSPGANYTLKDELSYAQTATHCMACRCSPIASKNDWMCNSRYIMHINVVSGWIQMDFRPAGITCILILFFVGLLNVSCQSTLNGGNVRQLPLHPLDVPFKNIETYKQKTLLLKGQYFSCEDILHQSALSCTTVVQKNYFWNKR